MADKMRTADAIVVGSIDVTTYVMLRSTANNQKVTGKVFGNFTLAYARTREAAVSVTPVTQTVTGSHADGGIVEVHATRSPGLYRVDWPDAAFVAGADEVMLTAQVAGAYVMHRAFGLTTAGFVPTATIPASPGAGTYAEAQRAALNVARGKKEMVQVAGQWKFRIYEFDDAATVWKEFDADHATAPSTVVPA